MSVDVTVALPTYNSAPILFLQLESLCRQVDAPPFEVIIYEERSENFAGAGYAHPFADRLESAGCRHICYVDLPKRTPLSEKWRVTAKDAASADVFLFCASDNYSPPDRLRLSYEAITGGADWFDWTSGHFYDIRTGSMGLYVRPVPERAAFGVPVRSGLFMATRTEYVASLPAQGPERNIDGWIKRHAPIERHQWQDGPAGLHTDGCNQISHYRAAMYAGGQYRRPFVPPACALEDCVPEDVAERLRAMQEVSV